MFKKFFYFLLLAVPALSQLSAPCERNCEGVNRVGVNFPSRSQVAVMDQCGWFPVKYDTGTFYYHNRETRENQWEMPYCQPELEEQ